MEVFIGNIARGVDENAILGFFKSKGVEFVEVRMLKNENGEFKGIGFGLCVDDASV